MNTDTTATDAGLPGFRGLFRNDTLSRSLYAEGAGIARAMPVAVAVPGDAEDLSVLVHWARREGHTLIPRGSGSGMAGGAVGTGVIVDLSRHTVIGPVDADRRTIRVGAGAVRGDVDAAARLRGLTFPVNPSSGAFCTIGGMIATNAAGARSLRFGATRSWVLGLHCVFDDGSMAWVRRDAPLPMHVPAVARLVAALDDIRAQVDLAALQQAGVHKQSSGYAIADALAVRGHLVDLLVGSEGTLAMFIEAELALAPLPAASATVLASFPTLDHAAACAVRAREAGAMACELLDRTFLDVATSGAGGAHRLHDDDADHGVDVPKDAEAVLLVEVHGVDAAQTTHAAQAMATACTRLGASAVDTAIDSASEHRLWSLRHAASPILASLAPRVRSMQFIEDGCVPPDRFADYVRGVRAALDRFETRGVIFGHAGDAHAHVNPLIDVSHTSWRDRVRGILDEVTELTARLGGTLSGEHGDGRLRAPLLSRVWSAAALEAFAAIKQAADPGGRFNAGCKVGAIDAEPIHDLKYDPEAPPIDPEARLRLDAIERDRAWNRFRLA